MFDIGWSEMLLVAVLAILVVGPKDLPRLMRTIGQWVGRAQAVARDFRRSIEQMAREAEIEDLRRELKEKADIEGQIAKHLDLPGSAPAAKPGGPEPAAAAPGEAGPARPTTPEPDILPTGSPVKPKTSSPKPSDDA